MIVIPRGSLTLSVDRDDLLPLHDNGDVVSGCMIRSIYERDILDRKLSSVQMWG